MPTSTQVQSTDFTRDVMGRYICNGFDEAVKSTRDGASPFHYIIIGGGMFGGTLASFLSTLDTPSEAENDQFKRYHSRVLVLEAGPFLLPEHEQNLPSIGIGTPGAETIAGRQPNPDTRKQPAPPRNEVWGLPWHSEDGYNGLAYCLGGRSLFWGGWAPRFLESEMPTAGPSPSLWPQQVVNDLQANKAALWDDAAHQIGADDPNDFVNGEMHTALREFYFNATNNPPTNGGIRHLIPLSGLPDYLKGQKATAANPGGLIPPNALKLDAPYAVQTSTRSGFFPFNKFSSVPLMIAASRRASGDSTGKTNNVDVNNSRRQVMIVPNVHVKNLVTLPVGGDRGDLRRVIAIETSQGTLPVAHNAVVILASAAIESARLALHSFKGARSYDQMGKNLMVHLRTNTQFRVPRSMSIFAGIAWEQLEMSGIQLRGKIQHPDQTEGHFHLQIAASGVPAGTSSSDAEIFQKVPDLDQFQFFKTTEDTEVAIAIRGIGEFSPKNPGSRVDLDPEVDEFGVPRAFVRINDTGNGVKPAIRNLNTKDSEVLKAMVEATNDVITIFNAAYRKDTNSDIPEIALNRPVHSEPHQGIDETLHIKLDGVGTTFHESGTLRMGDDPDDSVVDANLRFHGVTNSYVADMSILPTCGSANPVQPGVALGRRLARHLTQATPTTIPPNGMFLFKDTPTPFWRTCGIPATCVNFGFGDLEITSANGDFGLYWCLIPTPADFELSLDWLSTDTSDNSGVFIRFPDPDKAPPGKTKAFTVPGYTATEYGFEIQIDGKEGGGPPTNDSNVVTENVPPAFRGTGAVYNEGTQVLTPVSGLDVQQWHTFIIRARGNSIEVDVRVNGGPAQPRSRYTHDPLRYPLGDKRAVPERGLPSTPDVPRYIGLQAHNGTRMVKFRNIFIKPL